MPKNVFISHSSVDAALVQPHVALLENRGALCWIAPRDVVPGTNWVESIGDAIDSCDCVVLFLSTHANASVEVQKEVVHAATARRPIIPARLERVEPSAALGSLLGLAHRVDLFGDGYSVRQTHLLNGVQRFIFERVWRPEPTDVASRTSVVTAMNFILARMAETPLALERTPDRLGVAIQEWLSQRWHHFDPTEKGVLVRFLFGVGLIAGKKPIVGLSGFDLCEINLRGARMPAANLFNTDLRNADLRDAHLAGAVLQWAILGGAKFEGANLDGVTFVGNEIEDAGIEPSVLRSLGADIRRPD